MASGKLFNDSSTESCLGQSREYAQSGNDTVATGAQDMDEICTDAMAPKTLLTDCGAISVSPPRLVNHSSVQIQTFSL